MLPQGAVPDLEISPEQSHESLRNQRGAWPWVEGFVSYYILERIQSPIRLATLGTGRCGASQRRRMVSQRQRAKPKPLQWPHPNMGTNHRFVYRDTKD